MAMLDLLETVGEESYQQLLTAFQNGYEAHLTWPEDPIKSFQIGRILWKLNWIARFQPEYLMRSLESTMPIFEIYEQTGMLTLPK